MAIAYPALGRPLYAATYDGTNPATITPPQSASITNGLYSDSEAVNDAQSITLSVTFAVAPGVATEIHLASDPTFANYFVLDTLPISADKFAVWTTQNRLMGFIRIKNTSGQTISTAYVQKQVASVG